MSRFQKLSHKQRGQTQTKGSSLATQTKGSSLALKQRDRAIAAYVNFVRAGARLSSVWDDLRT